MIIQASGSNPPDDFFNSWLSVHAIPTSVLSACPADHTNAFQIASDTSAQGGEVVTNHQREDVDAAGNFSMPVAHTPRKPGRFLLCGYTDDGATTTLATASLALDVEDASPHCEARQRHEAAHNAPCEETRLQPGQLV